MHCQCIKHSCKLLKPRQPLIRNTMGKIWKSLECSWGKKKVNALAVSQTFIPRSLVCQLWVVHFFSFFFFFLVFTFFFISYFVLSAPVLEKKSSRASDYFYLYFFFRFADKGHGSALVSIEPGRRWKKGKSQSDLGEKRGKKGERERESSTRRLLSKAQRAKNGNNRWRFTVSAYVSAVITIKARRAPVLCDTVNRGCFGHFWTWKLVF